MKKLAGLVIILAAIILGGYYGMGIVTEKTIKKNVLALNQSNGLSADVVEYNRGFYTSEAKIEWRMHVPERMAKDAAGQSKIVAAQDYQIALPIKIDHGPVIYAGNKLRFGMGYAESNIAIPNQYTAQFDELFTKESTKPQLDLSIFVNYLNRSTVHFTLPTFKLIAKDGTGQLDWMGMNSSTSISDNADKVSGDLAIKGVQLTKDNAKLVLEAITSDYDLHQTSEGLLLGDAKFALPFLVVTVKEAKQFELHDFLLKSESDISKNLFNATLSLSVKSVFANGQTYGPGDMTLSLRNIDAETLAKLNEKASAMQNGTEIQRQQAIFALLPELPRLFSQGPELELSQLSLKIPEGMIKGNVLISLPKSDSSNPFELIQKMEGKAKFQFPEVAVKQLMQQSIMFQLVAQPQMKEELLKQWKAGQAQPNQTVLSIEQIATMHTENQLAALEKAGLYVVKGSDYFIEVDLKEGKFLVNGKPFDPAMVKF